MLSLPVRRLVIGLSVFCLLGLVGPVAPAVAQNKETAALDLKKLPGEKPRNIILILVDDLRYDVFSYMGHPFIETPNIDALAYGGARFSNAIVTTSLCSPSRATILTGQYMHTHGVVDNNTALPDEAVTFPQYLQAAGYQTAFIGKWHIGRGGQPEPGFDYWVSFPGQGRYYPPKNGKFMWNVNGEKVPQTGYVTDELTDYAINWLEKQQSDDAPFFLYLSHKAVHGNFFAAKRHDGVYADESMPIPETMANTPENYEDKPRWLKNQRNSWHGVDFPYHGRFADSGGLESIYINYCETVLAVDESVGRVMDWLEANHLAKETLVIFTSDNGFQWGEHGLIDKRTAYYTSIHVPMLVHCPEIIEAGTIVDEPVANLDLAPTILEAAGLATPDQMQGRSFLGLATGEMAPKKWRDYLLYEYYWEWNFPQTPTMFALIGDRFKYIQYYGIWDTDELYNMNKDPHETTNLIDNPKYQDVLNRMQRKLYQKLKATGGTHISFSMQRNNGRNLRDADGAETADFPPSVIVNPHKGK